MSEVEIVIVRMETEMDLFLKVLFANYFWRKGSIPSSAQEVRSGIATGSAQGTICSVRS